MDFLTKDLRILFNAQVEELKRQKSAYGWVQWYRKTELQAEEEGDEDLRIYALQRRQAHEAILLRSDINVKEIREEILEELNKIDELGEKCNYKDC